MEHFEFKIKIARYGFRNAKSCRALAYPYLVRDSIPKTLVYLQPTPVKKGATRELHFVHSLVRVRRQMDVQAHSLDLCLRAKKDSTA